MNNKTKLLNINGYKVLIIQNEKFTTNTVGIMYKAGSANDFKGKNGLASIVSRLLFRGAKKDKNIIAMEVIGSEIKYLIEREYSYYSIESTDNDIKSMIKTLLHITENLDVGVEEINNEKKIILTKLLSRLDDVQESMTNIVHENTFSRQVIGKPKYGKPRTINSITREDIMEFYNKYYNIKNVIIVIATTMSVRDASHFIEPFLNSHKTGSKEGIFTAFKRYTFYAKSKYTYKNTKILGVSIASQIPGFKDYHKKVQGDVACKIISGCHNSILSSKTRDLFGVQKVSCEAISYNSIGVMKLSSRIEPLLVKEFISHIHETLKSSKINDDLFQSSIKNLITQKNKIANSSDETALDIAVHYLNLRKMKKNNFDIEIISSINKESVVELIRSIATSNKNSIFCLGPRLDRSMLSLMNM